MRAEIRSAAWLAATMVVTVEEAELSPAPLTVAMLYL
jgi:hypothetical protein